LKTISILALRILMGIIFVTHGAARLYYQSVPEFGAFLNSKGLVIGVALAWVVTIGEIIAGSMLASGYKVTYAIIFHAIVIFAGIILVHFPNGWFTVGHGTGGVEYSLLILAVLAVLYSHYKPSRFF
jgi:putative oxidoreductase